MEKIPISDEERSEHDSHFKENACMRSEKKKDKENCTENNLMIVFNLENVITLPKADVSSFFYKRKLSPYHLAAQTIVQFGLKLHQVELEMVLLVHL